jgi:hypothetical protein
MRARVLLWICLGLNVLLAVMVVLLARDAAQQLLPADISVRGKNASPLVKTNVVLRRQPFTWSEVESPDYRTYIANLRRAGCPEKTIRDIIVADVNDLYAERIAREIVFPEQKWWLPEPDADAFEAGMSQLRALETEKNRLLTDLLGPDWAKSSSSIATIAGLEARQGLYADALRFDGPILSKLSPEARANVRQIEQRAAQSREQLTARARLENREPSPAELSLLHQETRRQLAGVLTNDQLEEYLLRYSQTADQMRDQLRGFGADAEEFRRIFRVRDAYDQQLAALTGTDASTQQRRAEIERQRDQTLNQEMGPERYSIYQMTQNPLFRQAQQQAEESGAPPEKVLPIFRINQATQDEIARVQADRTISDDQRQLALVTIQQQQRNSISRILANTPAEQAAAPSRPARPGLPTQLVPPSPPGVAGAQ